MNTEKVFIGFNKSDEEILLYRKDNNTYIDLLSKNGCVYPIENIDLLTLYPATKIIELKKHMLKILIKRKYKKDRSQIIDTRNILYGEIIEVNKHRIRYDKNDIIHREWLPLVVEHSLFIEKNNNWSSEWVDITNGRKYKTKEDSLVHFKNGIRYIQLSNVNLEEISKTTVMDKKDASEIAYQIKKKYRRI